MTGEPARGDEAFFEMIRTHRARTFFRVMGKLPSAPRCAVCHAPFGGVGGQVMRRFGFGPSRKNPRLCSQCFEKAPDGGVNLDVGVLFADVRGFTSMAEGSDPQALVPLLNAFYDAAVEVLCQHAIIDKLVGDQVMAVYLPQVLGEGAVEHMVADALALVASAPDQLSLGVGLDYGTAFVGNVGSGEVKDFTAIGDVVNTAARLQSAAASGEVILSGRVMSINPTGLRHADPRSLVLKGKSQPEHAFALTVDR
ncbi:MAG TPA: adenylate/guanylate cyclase domain-containing protein [Solirubrobacteraceae bacterium]|nr:adenylate/guanylate cyclase domain-containing protein [Solirubrobacteraceae bacterium]